MKNILSFKPGTPIKGSDIVAWVKYHTDNQTSKTKYANTLLPYIETLEPDELYRIDKIANRTGFAIANVRM